MKTKSSLAKQRSGIALIVVMISVTVLGILVIAFAYSMKVETRLAMNSNNEADLLAIGWGNIQKAAALLALRDPAEGWDSLNQKWAGGPGSALTSNLLAVVELPPGTKIVDMERRANINIIAQGSPQQRQLLEQAMRLMGVDPADSGPIMSSIVDWIDADDNENPNGTESDYYESLPTPYKCKNGPIDDMSELLHIRGVTREIFWGGAAENNLQSGMKSRLRQNDQPQVYPVGLADLFTALSAGPININTAPREVLAMVLNGDEAAADRIIACRGGPDGADGTEDDVPFRNPQEGLACAQIPNAAIPGIAGFFSVRSRLFQVEVTAEYGGTTRYFYAVIDRDAPPDKKVLTFFWKHDRIKTNLNRNADAR